MRRRDTNRRTMNYAESNVSSIIEVNWLKYRALEDEQQIW
jgi:hypothetical protein